MRSPPEDGFFSLQMDEWTNVTRSSAPEWFTLIEDLNRCAVAVLPTLQPRLVIDRQLASATLYARAVQTFEATILLAQRGMLADAGTLARSIAETALYLGGFARVEGFFERMVAANNQHFFKHGQAILDLKKRNGEELDSDAEELKALLDGVKGQGHSFQDINMRNLALEIGLDPLYETVYRQLSGNAAHPSLTSAERHVVRSEGKRIEKLTFSPQRDGMEKILSCAIFSLLCAMEGISAVYEREDLQESIDLFNARHQKLSEAFSEL